MARENSSRYVLLGLIDWSPMSGYDIKKIVEENIRDFWNESYGNIYPTLQKLVNEGLAEKRVERQDGKPDRNVYSITTAGRGALLDWLRTPTGERRTRDVFLAKFIFSHHLTTDASIEQLESYRENRAERLDWYRRTEAELVEAAFESRKSLLEFLALRQGVLLTEARVKWCEEALVALRQLKRDEKEKG
jgi:DNA-binding PadR family transcriptional regulator